LFFTTAIPPYPPVQFSGSNILQTAIAAIKTAAEQRTWPDLVVLDAVFPSKANTTPTFMAGEFLRLIEEISDDRGQELPDVILVSGQREAADQFDTIVEWLDAGKIRDVLPKSVADVGWHVFQAILRHKARQLQRERDLRTSITANEAFVSLEAHGIITCDESMIILLPENWTGG
jgi:CheY-like chemotaxis protein